MPINVRPAAVEDALRIAEVHVSAWRAAYRGIVPSEYLDALSVTARETMWRRCLANGNPELCVAEATDGLVGWIAFGTSRDVDAPDGTGELEAIYVLPSYWSTGVGQALWKAAQKRLAQRGFRRVTVWVLADNERAIRFYRAAGFQASSAPARSIEIGQRPLPEVRYEVSLG